MKVDGQTDRQTDKHRERRREQEDGREKSRGPKERTEGKKRRREAKESGGIERRERETVKKVDAGRACIQFIRLTLSSKRAGEETPHHHRVSLPIYKSTQSIHLSIQ